MQRVPWPEVDGAGAGTRGVHDTWVINDEELPWLVDADGATCAYQTLPCALCSRAPH